MGSNFVTTTYSLKTAPTKEKLISCFWQTVEAAQGEYGHGGYSGTFAEFRNICVHDKAFTDFNAAQEYIEEHGEKRDPAVAVRLTTAKGFNGWLVGGWVPE